MSRMFDEIKTDIDNRMSVYNHSMQPTSDEVTIAWLVTEIERLKSLSGFKEDGKEKGTPFDEWGYDQMKKKDSLEEGEWNHDLDTILGPPDAEILSDDAAKDNPPCNCPSKESCLEFDGDSGCILTSR